MPEKPVTTDRRRPVLGWVSVGIAVSVFVLIVGPTIGDVTLKLRAPTSDGINAVAGGVDVWVFYILMAITAAGVISAVVGLMRGEQRRWVHAVGVVLNLGAPVAAATLLLVFG